MSSDQGWQTEWQNKANNGDAWLCTGESLTPLFLSLSSFTFFFLMIFVTPYDVTSFLALASSVRHTSATWLVISVFFFLTVFLWPRFYSVRSVYPLRANYTFKITLQLKYPISTLSACCNSSLQVEKIVYEYVHTTLNMPWAEKKACLHMCLIADHVKSLLTKMNTCVFQTDESLTVLWSTGFS